MPSLLGLGSGSVCIGLPQAQAQDRECWEPYCFCLNFFFCRPNHSMEGYTMWRVGPDPWTSSGSQKWHMSTWRGGYNQGQHVLTYNSHTASHIEKTLYPQIPWKEVIHVSHFLSTIVFHKMENWKMYVFRFLPNCVKLGMYTLKLPRVLFIIFHGCNLLTNKYCWLAMKM